MAAKKKKSAAKKTATKKKATKRKATKKKKVSPIPKGYNQVTAAMNVPDAAATIEFCKKVFGGKLRMSMPMGGGKLMHAEVAIGDSVIMLSDAVREPVRLGSLCVYVKDVDKTIEKAVSAGAKVLNPAMDMFWGDRFSRVVDPSGNHWSIATHIEDVTPGEVKKRMKAAAAQMGA
jgi:PhnB protein